MPPLLLLIKPQKCLLAFINLRMLKICTPIGPSSILKPTYSEGTIDSSVYAYELALLRITMVLSKALRQNKDANVREMAPDRRVYQ